MQTSLIVDGNLLLRCRVIHCLTTDIMFLQQHVMFLLRRRLLQNNIISSSELSLLSLFVPQNKLIRTSITSSCDPPDKRCFKSSNIVCFLFAGGCCNATSLVAVDPDSFVLCTTEQESCLQSYTLREVASCEWKQTLHLQRLDLFIFRLQQQQ